MVLKLTKLFKYKIKPRTNHNLSFKLNKVNVGLVEAFPV